MRSLSFRMLTNTAGQSVLVSRIPAKKPSVLSFPVRLTVEHGGQYHRHTTKIPKRSDHNPRAA